MIAGDCQKGGLASATKVAAELAVRHLMKTYVVTDQNEVLALLPSAIWSMPETASVGLTEAELRKRDNVQNSSSKGYSADTAKWALRTQHEIDEASILDSQDRENAFIKIIFDERSSVVLGIHIVGPGASELIQYAHSCIKKPLDYILRTAPTAVTLCCAFSAAAMNAKQPESQKEAKNFRPRYDFMKKFLAFDRETRMEECDKAFNQPSKSADKALLDKTIVEVNKDPQEQAEQARLLKDIYAVWNNCLVDLEETQWQDQAPKAEDWALPSDAIVAVVGGKHTQSFRGTGDWVVSLLLDSDVKHLFSHSRSAADEAPAECKCAGRYTHHRKLEDLVKDVAEKKAADPDAPVVFIYTIGFTAPNGDNIKNNKCVEDFIAELDKNKLLDDETVKVCATSTFHGSPKEAGHEDNLTGDDAPSIPLSFDALSSALCIILVVMKRTKEIKTSRLVLMLTL